MDDVLQVGGGAGDPLDAGRRAGERRVRRLGDRDAAAFSGCSRWYTSRRQYSGSRCCRRRGSARSRRPAITRSPGPRPSSTATSIGAVGGLLRSPRVPHQADVAVEVHRLVRLVRQRGVRLALEAGELGAEDPGQPAVQLDGRARASGTPPSSARASQGDRRSGRSRWRARSATWSTKNSLTWSTISSPAAMSSSQAAAARYSSASGSTTSRGGRVARREPLEPTSSERAGTARAGPRSALLDLGGQRAGRLEPASTSGSVGCGGSSSSSTTRRSGYSCSAAHHSGQRTTSGSSAYDGTSTVTSAVVGEVPVEHAARHPLVVAEPVERPCRAKVHRRREGQEGDDDQVHDRLDREPEAAAVVDELADDRRDDVADPEQDRDDDRERPAGDLRALGRGWTSGSGSDRRSAPHCRRATCGLLASSAIGHVFPALR